MKRTELKIPPDRPSSGPKTCLAFRYRQTDGLKDIPKAVGFGLRVLNQIADELRRKGYEVSEPSTGKKSFGITAMRCRAGSNELGISAWPPEKGDDQWQIRSWWLPKFEPLREMTQSEAAAWDSIRDILNEVVTSLEGARDARWLSYEEAEEPQQESALPPKQTGSR